MDRAIPRGLRLGKFPYSSILYMALSSVFFMLLYMPFSPTTWFSVKTPRLTLLTAAFVAAAVLVLVVSNAIFIEVCRTKTIRTWQYFLWSVAEIVVISAVYIAETAVFSLGYYRSAASLVTKTFFCVTVILIVPYIVIYAHFFRKERRETQDTAGDEPLGDTVKPLKDRMINFRDDAGVLKLSADVDSILYIKSEGNYVDIFYEKGDEVVPYMMKASISSLEKSLAGTPLVRCQRSYIVNTKRIRMMQNDNRAIYIIVDNDKVPVIPMSPAYVSAVSDVFRKK